jgi:hypothetical protein
MTTAKLKLKINSDPEVRKVLDRITTNMNEIQRLLKVNAKSMRDFLNRFLNVGNTPKDT